MQILVVGLDHHTCPVEVRERLAFSVSQLEAAYDHLLHAHGPLGEAAILSTCNRVEVYGVAEDVEQAHDAIDRFLHVFHGLPAGSVTAALYHFTDKRAVDHLFATTCGLQSLIVGEAQIQGQVRAAAISAAELQALGPVLNALFRHAIEVGKRARTETGIGRSAVSISHAGVELARRLIGSLEGRHVLLVGSGKMSELAAKNLIDNGAQSITLVNRTVETAQILADRWDGRALPFEALPDALRDADVVISSTSAPHPVIRAEHVRAALAARSDRPLLLIDLAVPRDVEGAVAAIAGAYVYDIDDLEQVVRANLQARHEELAAAQRIVSEETEEFMGWMASRSVVPTLSRLRSHADSISRAELEKAMRRLGSLSQRDREVVEALATGIVNKLLHQPTVRLKQEAAEGNGTQYAEALRFLFDLDRA